MNGYKAWWLLDSDKYFRWSAKLDDGLIEEDIMIITIQGTSTCSLATWTEYPIATYETLPLQEPAVSWSMTGIFDSVSLGKGLNDYCGPYTINAYQDNNGGEVDTLGPLTLGTLDTDNMGYVQIDFEIATLSMTGLQTLQVQSELFYFPTAAKSTLTVTVDYKCPDTPLFEIVRRMPQDFFIYDVTSQETLEASLTTFQHSTCFQVENQRIVRVDTRHSLDIFTIGSGGESFKLWTED